jgi:hypothetical protein
MTSSIATLIAHQGGWDEILLVAGPIVVVGGLLAVATRRARALGSTPQSEESDSSEAARRHE